MALLVAALCLTLAAAFAALCLRSNRRLRQLERVLTATGGGNTPQACRAEQALAIRREEIAGLRTQAGQARAVRLRADQLACDTDARYALAVQGANDAAWEWNLATGEAYFSPAWSGLLGLGDADLGNSFDAWLRRVHPDERVHVKDTLAPQVSASDARLALDHRLLHHDGSWRWVHTRATVLRNESGAAYRIVGLTSDIGARRRAEQTLLDVANGLSTLSGNDCYQQLVRRLAEIVGAPEAFLCVCADHPATRVRMLAHWTAAGTGALEDFELQGTPCKEVIEQGRTVFAARGARHRWPREYEECRLEAYLGLPCFDTQGRVIGHLACKSADQMHPDLPHQAVLKLFALRAAVELERRQNDGERDSIIARNGA